MSSSSKESGYPTVIKAGIASHDIKKGEIVVYDPPYQIVSSDHPASICGHNHYMKKNGGKKCEKSS